MRNRLGLWWLMGACVLACGGTSMAQGVTTPEQGDDAMVLAGPSADEAGVPGMAGLFGMGLDGPRERGPIDRRIDGWMLEIVRTMASLDPEDAVRLEPEQAEAIRASVERHEERQRTYRREHREEIRRLRADAGIDERGQRVANPNADQRAARQRLRAINRGAPTSERVRGEIWAVLDDAQRTHLMSELRARRDASLRERADEMGMVMGEGGALILQTPELDEQLEDLFERVRALPPAQQRQLLRRAHDLLDRVERDAREHEQRRDAPTMSDGV